MIYIDFNGNEILLNNITQDWKRFLTKKIIENLKTEAHPPFYRLSNPIYHNGGRGVVKQFIRDFR